MISNEQKAHDLTILALPDAIKNDDIFQSLIEEGKADAQSKPSQYLAAYNFIYNSFLSKITDN